MSTQKGRNVRVEIGSTEGTTKSISAVTKASPAVASSTGHGQTAGTIGYLTGVEGMVELEGQAVSVISPETDAFSLEGLDTSGFTTFSGTTVFTPISAWKTLSESTGYTVDDAPTDKIDSTTLLDIQRRNESGMLGVQNVKFNALSNPQGEAMAIIRAAARSGTAKVFRVTFPNGERRVFRGVPSLPGETVSVGAMATGSFDVTVAGQVLMLAAVA